MKRILKYHLELNDRVQLIPKYPHSQIVLVAVQNGRITLWVECDPDEFHSRTELEVITRGFLVYGTGHAIPDRNKHVGSVLLGDFVWHVYEVP